MTRSAIGLLLAISIAACTPFPVSRDHPVEPDSTGAGSQANRDAGTASAPSAGLLQQARSHLAAAEYPEAAASLERAIRIEPDNARLWLELARVHFASGNLQQAQAHARKASSLAGSDDAARSAAEKLLADIAVRQR